MSDLITRPRYTSSIACEGGRLGEKDTSDTITKTENETLYPALPKRVSFICKPKLT